jgi:hypothetical protein
MLVLVFVGFGESLVFHAEHSACKDYLFPAADKKFRVDRLSARVDGFQELDALLNVKE